MLCDVTTYLAFSCILHFLATICCIIYSLAYNNCEQVTVVTHADKVSASWQHPTVGCRLAEIITIGYNQLQLRRNDYACRQGFSELATSDHELPPS